MISYFLQNFSKFNLYSCCYSAFAQLPKRRRRLVTMQSTNLFLASFHAFAI